MKDKLKIIIVEDNEHDVELLLCELNKSDLYFSSEIVQTREEYIETFDNFMPHLILSDYALPSFDGVTAFHLKQKKNKDIPFIIVSGTIGEERAVELIKNGINDYVLKDKLFTLNPKITRALKDADDIKAKRIVDEKLKIQNQKILEIAFLQSHQMRVPVVHILGLYNLFNFEDPSDPINVETLSLLKESAESLDKIIREIAQKILEIEAI